MLDKFSFEDLMIRVMPGGLLLGVALALYSETFSVYFNQDLDFLYTFLFFCAAFIAGEVLQTLAHSLEFFVDIFFRMRRPSKVFLYKQNPVLKSDYKREELLKLLDLNTNERALIDREYSDIPLIFKGDDTKQADDLSQSIFWRLYSKVSSTSEIVQSNASYLFCRVIFLVFLLVGLLLFTQDYRELSVIAFAIALIFLWRARGVARGLVHKIIQLNLKRKI